MSEPFIAEIRIVPYDFAPRGWASCDGQLLPIAQNTALFSLVGTTYGGDGQSSFALPNLRDRAPMHPGHGAGLSLRRLGEQGGASSVAITEAQMPAHDHGAVLAYTTPATTGTPSSDVAFAQTPAGSPVYGPATDLEPTGDSPGAGAPHANRQPYLGLHFVIALVGLYPSRS
ncbi:MAG: phage tail protein [Ectothiorhodospiraceae bacterium]|nr:phage tail protein [Chromatiales bacterium]MCP5156543.1 phage tail protein [Ectothiorhodospiraceae bacterium]